MVKLKGIIPGHHGCIVQPIQQIDDSVFSCVCKGKSTLAVCFEDKFVSETYFCSKCFKELVTKSK